MLRTLLFDVDLRRALGYKKKRVPARLDNLLSSLVEKLRAFLLSARKSKQICVKVYNFLCERQKITDPLIKRKLLNFQQLLAAPHSIHVTVESLQRLIKTQNPWSFSSKHGITFSESTTHVRTFLLMQNSIFLVGKTLFQKSCQRNVDGTSIAISLRDWISKIHWARLLLMDFSFIDINFTERNEIFVRCFFWRRNTNARNKLSTRQKPNF